MDSRFAAIMWVGQTFLFHLDGSCAKRRGIFVDGSQRRLLHRPAAEDSQRLAAAIAVPLGSRLDVDSGLALLIVVYYAGGLMETNGVGGLPLAVLMGMAFLALAWAVYDFLWQSVFANHETLGVSVSYGLLVAVTFALTRLLDGRAAYIHVGAILGTIMTANVWMRILPFQRKLVAAAQQGALPDMSLALRAKQRTKHNTYMVVPVVFIMISNHFPVATYGSSHNWLVLSILILAGWFAAKLLRER
jgi:uncharacterized membrane protein